MTGAPGSTRVAFRPRTCHSAILTAALIQTLHFLDPYPINNLPFKSTSLCASHDVQADEFSDEGGSPGGRNKRVQANRLSAQRSRQRKLEREAQLMGDVDKLGREIAKLHHEEGALIQQEAGEISVSLHLSYQTTQGASSATNLLCWAARSPSSTTRRAPSSSRRLVRGHTFPC